MFPLLERCDGGEGSIALHPIVLWDSATTKIAKSLGEHNPSQIVVLARTSRLLRTVALACLEAGTPFKTNNKVLRLAESEQVLLAYLRLLSNSRDANATDVDKVFRVPNRYLPKGNVNDVVKRLQKGQTFSQAISSLSVEDWRRVQLAQATGLFDRLSHESDAEKLVHALRTEGGLDKHYSDQERMSPHDQVEIEVLDSVLLESRGKIPKVLAEVIAAKGRLLSTAVSNAQGVELTTIHGSKGREWDRVVVFGWNENQIPHKRVLLEHQANPELLEQAIEDERRLAYVAMTRAKARLNFIYENGNESRFLKEAGLSIGNAAKPSTTTTKKP
jgi:DNA helicase-2/ATP-dependent DNA helicase PcrA